MITCNLIGGLGNQLFQIFTTITYAMRTKQKFIFFKTDKTGGGITKIRDTYWNNLLYKLAPFLIVNLPTYNLIRENSFNYNDIILEIVKYTENNNHVCLYGYFQSYKYFQNNFNTIYRMLDFEKQKETVSQIFSKHYLENAVSLHFRIGDYKLWPNIYPIMSYQYYEKALLHIEKNNSNFLQILFFCEDEDLDEVNIIIEKLKSRFQHNSFSRAPNTLKDWEQMLLMSCCKCNVVANSSFSWWGAYLNTTCNKIVCYPETWFLNNTDSSDLCPPEWVKISNIYNI